MITKKIGMFFISCLLILTICSGCLFSEKDVIIVETGNGFDSISAAVEQAKSGETIKVKSGIYEEHINIDKSIVLIGEDKTKTIIDGQGKDDVVMIIGDGVEMSGFTIRNAGNDTSGEEDAGVDVRSENNVFTDLNFSYNGNYGMFFYQAHNNSVFGCVFDSNAEGGIYSVDCNGNKFNQCVFTLSERGIFCERNENVSFINNSVSQHDVKGMYLYGSKYSVIKDNMFTGNEEGIHVKGSTENEFVSNLIMGNTIGMEFCCGGSDNLVYRNVFMNNIENHVEGYPINDFDNGEVGNYWDDYNGTDSDGDGIGDTPYIVNTSTYQVEDNVDHYPLMSPS